MLLPIGQIRSGLLVVGINCPIPPGYSLFKNLVLGLVDFKNCDPLSRMKITTFCGIKQLFTRDGNGTEGPKNALDLDLREEYANAFRTESYNEFWERVVALGKGNAMPQTARALGSTTAARLPSYRLFVDHLLDPDQPTVTRILALTHTRNSETVALLSDYFLETANASFMCSHLLRDVDRTRIKYKSLKKALDSSIPVLQISPTNPLPILPNRLTEFLKTSNPFVPSALSSNRIQTVQTNCSDLLKRLESSRDRARAKLEKLTRLERGSAVFLVVLTASLTIIIAAHALALLAAAPCLMATSLELVSARKLARREAQLDAAAKGTYIVMREVDTISRLVGRLSDELDDIHGAVQFWVERGGEDRLQASGEGASQLKMKKTSFAEQLDELEEHLYLHFMTINRARNLVLKEFLDHLPSLPPPSPNLIIT